MPWSDQHKSSRGQCSIPDLSFVAVLQQTPCQQPHVPYGSRIDSPVRVHVRDGCWDNSEEPWQGSCPKLKVRRFCGDYHMFVGPLSVCKYGWWMWPWSPTVVVLSPVPAEWESEVYLSALIHPPYRFLHELSQIRVLCHRLVKEYLSELPCIEVKLSDSFTETCSSLSMALSLIEDDLFCTSSKRSVNLFRNLFVSDMSLVPSALRSGEKVALVGP